MGKNVPGVVQVVFFWRVARCHRVPLNPKSSKEHWMSGLGRQRSQGKMAMSGPRRTLKTL